MGLLRKAQRNIPPFPPDVRTENPCGLSPLKLERGWTCDPKSGRRIPPPPGMRPPPTENQGFEPQRNPCAGLTLTIQEQQEGWTIDENTCSKVPPRKIGMGIDPRPRRDSNPSVMGIDPRLGQINQEVIDNSGSSDLFNRRGGSFRRKGGTVMGSGNWRGKTVPGMRRGGVVRKK